MSMRPFITTLAILLTFALIAPPLFLITPQKTRAQFFGGGGGGGGAVILVGETASTAIKRTVESTISAIRNTITSIATVTSAAANTAMQINAYVLQPLAFVLSGNLLKLITAGVIAFVIGKANGTGIPQFVVDVQKSLQTVGDAKALAFFDQFGRNSNSPFAGSISSALRNDYLSKTSLAGFWAANMNTLAASTPSYRPGYLAGNWSQGGIAAWFALTTQTRNNPYTLYQNSQEQLAALVGPGVGGATGARIAELGWGNGFMSWCGEFGSSYTPTRGGSGVNPGDPCYDKDGNPSTIKTPGTVIVDALNRALGTDHDVLVRMGNVGPEINGILRDIATVMQTVNFATQLLGGPGSGGLLGVDTPSGANSTSRLMQYQNTPGYLGATNSGIYQNAAALPASGSDMLSRVTQYESAWSTIGAAANAASTTVASLADFCSTAADAARSDFELANFVNASTAQAAAARVALTATIAPVLAEAAAAAKTSADARAMVQKVQNQLNSSNESTSGVYALDLQTLQSMSPTASDVANIQQEAQAFGTAAAVPAGSLTVSGGSLIDRMSLIGTNAEALKTSVCTPSSAGASDGGSAI